LVAPVYAASTLSSPHADLIAPTVGLHTAWLEAHDEWGPGVHEDGFAIAGNDRD
jgi:hypothetical protein